MPPQNVRKPETPAPAADSMKITLSPAAIELMPFRTAEAAKLNEPSSMRQELRSTADEPKLVTSIQSGVGVPPPLDELMTSVMRILALATDANEAASAATRTNCFDMGTPKEKEGDRTIGWLDMNPKDVVKTSRDIGARRPSTHGARGR